MYEVSVLDLGTQRHSYAGFERTQSMCSRPAVFRGSSGNPALSPFGVSSALYLLT
jgi:hypothetical protein